MFSCSTWIFLQWNTEHKCKFSKIMRTRVEKLKKKYVSFWDIFKSTKITSIFILIVMAHNVPVCDRWMEIALLVHSNLTHVSKKTWGILMEQRARRKVTPSLSWLTVNWNIFCPALLIEGLQWWFFVRHWQPTSVSRALESKSGFKPVTFHC